MKKSIFLPLSILLITASCNNSAGSTKAAVTSAIMSEDAPSTAGTGKGTISCLMDGKQKTFTLQQSFFEIRLDPYSKGPTDAIEILDGSTKKEGFQFEFKKSGSTKIKKDTGGDINCIINYYNPQGITYTGEDVTINVTLYNQTQLTGTFTGKLANVHYEKGSDKYPESIQITEGKFDLQN
jgi:hypothetical protein